MRLKKWKMIIAVATTLIVFMIGFICFAYFVHSPSKRVILEIPEGSGLKSIALKLEESGVIRSDKLFILYVFFKGGKGRLKAGEYEFKPGDSLTLVVKKLIEGDVVVHKITIPEGLTMNEIGELLEKNGFISKGAFLEKARSAEFRRELLGDSIPSFEGYLFPDTYLYTKGITSEEFIRMMVSRFKKVYKSLRSKAGESFPESPTNSSGTPYLRLRSGRALSPLQTPMNLTDHEIVTLASIIEKETGNASERPLISAVFYNRLRFGMRLESDPTVIYAMGDNFDGNLRKKDLRTESEYNTYRIFGLPPGPIANPGGDSLRAALNPAKVNYLYFVSKGDGTHEFSSNYIDHQRAITEYQK